MATHRDTIYQTMQEVVPDFVFDDKVAQVFEDMISRSVPGYTQILKLLPTLARRFYTENSHCYDLGCSLGAGLIALAQGLRSTNHKLIGIDNSAAMIDRASQTLKALTDNNSKVELIVEDITKSKIENASIVLMNFTLQFIDINNRDNLLSKIYAGLNPNGALILSEKITFEDDTENQLLTDLHHQYKSDQGYSELEISQKRDAIENVLVAENLQDHLSRLKKVGFKIVTPWIQNLQFISILAVK